MARAKGSLMIDFPTWMREKLMIMGKERRDEFIVQAVSAALSDSEAKAKTAKRERRSESETKPKDGVLVPPEAPIPLASPPPADPVQQPQEEAFEEAEEASPSAAAEALKAANIPQPIEAPSEPAHGQVPEIELVNQGTHYIVRFYPGNVRKLYRVDPRPDGAPTLHMLRDLKPDVQIPVESIIRGKIPDGTPSAPAAQPKPAAPVRMTFPFEMKSADGHYKILSFGGRIMEMKLTPDGTGKSSFRHLRDISKKEASEMWERRTK
jgi:hypothetical protein